VGDFTDPPTAPRDLGVSQSAHCSDRLINPHPRFATLTNNIRKRRGSKVSIKVPLFLDSATAEAATAEARAAGADPEEEVYMSGLPGERRRRAETIEMDCMAYGMGMCCLQVTFQARDLQESRHLYDQLAVLTPIFLALSAATPVLHGRLADTDVRWATIAASVDDRTPMERGQQVCDPSHKGQMGFMAGGGERTLPKSRYESISSYICNCKGGDDPTASTDRFNDIDCPIDEASYATLVAAGIDARLARHVAHLFVRDPLVIYSERIHIPDSTATDHFENIQSTNWQTVRWKPPPVNSNSNIGWRVEFRSMEVQLTPPPLPYLFPYRSPYCMPVAHPPLF
jgi:glutamate--cysteine ligase catalytic subunit